jgi:hypothetical protein
MNRYITIGKTCYGYNDNDFDGFFNQILMEHEDPDYSLENNADDIKSYFADNVEQFFDDIPSDEDTDYTDVIEGFNEYIDWLLTL